jgi:hypothetical protein
MPYLRRSKSFLVALGLGLVLAASAQASETVGSIDATFKATRICHDAACATYGNLNWRPTLNGSTSGAVAVVITDSGLTGHLWGDEIGWVKLAPTGAGVSLNPTTGALTGYAFANTGGWIKFNPTGGGVTIDSQGQFSGSAWVSGLRGGWVKFDCAQATTCVKTDWRPTGSRTGGAPADDDSGDAASPAAPPITGGGGSGYGVASPTPAPLQWLSGLVNRLFLSPKGVKERAAKNAEKSLEPLADSGVENPALSNAPEGSAASPTPTTPAPGAAPTPAYVLAVIIIIIWLFRGI